MQRFYLPFITLNNPQLNIEDPRVVYQAFKVLRMKVKSFFHAFNEKEGEFLFQIESLDKKVLIAKKIESVPNHNEPRLRVTLFQSIPKKPGLFELILQKATELGVNDIYPLITERTENRRLTKFERLTSIAMEATEQSRRLQPPVIHHPMTLETAVKQMDNAYMGYEYEEENYLGDYDKELYKKKNLQLIIGPEGGFSQKEIRLARESGVRSFSLGPRILRLETAAVSALALLLLDKRAND